MRYCHTSTRKAKIQKTKQQNKQTSAANTNHEAGCRATGTLPTCLLVGIPISWNLAAPYKALHVPLYDPAIVSLGIYSTAKIIPLLVPISVLLHTQKLHTNIYNNFIHNCLELEATKMPFDEWINKLSHSYNGLLSSDKITDLWSHKKWVWSLNVHS